MRCLRDGHLAFVRDRKNQMEVTGFNDIRGWFSSTLIEEVGLVLKVICDNFVGLVITYIQQIGGFVWDEFVGKEVRVGIVIGGVDAVSGVVGYDQ